MCADLGGSVGSEPAQPVCRCRAPPRAARAEPLAPSSLAFGTSALDFLVGLFSSSGPLALSWQQTALLYVLPGLSSVCTVLIVILRKIFLTYFCLLK